MSRPQQSTILVDPLADSPLPEDSRVETPDEKRLRLRRELAELEEEEVAASAVVVPDGKADDPAVIEAKRLQHETAVRNGAVEPTVSYDTTPREGHETVLMHFLEDGFTALGQMWVRGQELEFVIVYDDKGKVVGSDAYLATQDRNGVSWVALADDEMQQVKHYGKVLFRRGPWPGLPWPDDKAAQEERRRNRTPPVPSRITRRT